MDLGTASGKTALFWALDFPEKIDREIERANNVISNRIASSTTYIVWKETLEGCIAAKKLLDSLDKMF